ncbi:arginine deiminase family protein [Niallia circulans]|uniref:dimethylarginine dimethylaminohydrolase family protein n=1 Tax=Niallia circulans TaxID=1397 RepID=UPI0020411CE2|nr:arginine deiminase family protein [Niallia circulans]MCM2979311.1 arginine deiminase family protein [Niallia circulans]
MKINCSNEYDPLKTVVLVSPEYMAIKVPINDIQKKHAKKNIDKKLAVKQHEMFIETLQKNGVEIILLPAEEKYHEQVFTRDIGFTLGSQIFVAEMARDARHGEERVLIDYLKKKEITYTDIKGNFIEGGDVIIDGKTIFAGISQRTNEAAIRHLQTLMPSYDVIAVPFTDTYLHLDCVFNILSPTEGLIFPGEFHKEKEKLLRERFDFIHVSAKEQETLGTNVLSIGNKKVISLPMNEGVNKELQKRGYEVLEVDFSEIIKSGGSFRCCSMPLLRE